MQGRVKGRDRLVVGVFAVIAAAILPACSIESSFQPLAYGAKPWTPPAGWDPQPNPGGQPGCPAGYYIAIRSCDGCQDISYALCDAAAFTQCVCGGPPWKYPSSSGSACPQGLSCNADDFPPPNWLEFADYTGPGWAGLQSAADSGI